MRDELQRASSASISPSAVVPGSGATHRGETGGFEWGMFLQIGLQRSGPEASSKATFLALPTYWRQPVALRPEELGRSARCRLVGIGDDHVVASCVDTYQAASSEKAEQELPLTERTNGSSRYCL